MIWPCEARRVRIYYKEGIVDILCLLTTQPHPSTLTQSFVKHPSFLSASVKMRLSLATIALLAGSAVTTPLLPRSDSAPATTVLVPSDTVPSSPPSSPTVAASAGLASSPADVAIIATVYEKEVLNEAFTTPTIPTTGCVLASIPQFTDTQTLPDGSLRPAVIPEGLYCECAANSGRHEIPSTSYNTLGTMFLYCGNVGTAPVPTLISTATPVPNPGDPENPSVSIALLSSLRR